MNTVINVTGVLRKDWKKDDRSGVICRVYTLREAKKGELGQIPDQFYATPEAVQAFDGQGEYEANVVVEGGDRPRVEVVAMKRVKR